MHTLLIAAFFTLTILCPCLAAFPHLGEEQPAAREITR